MSGLWIRGHASLEAPHPADQATDWGTEKYHTNSDPYRPQDPHLISSSALVRSSLTMMDFHMLSFVPIRADHVPASGLRAWRAAGTSSPTLVHPPKLWGNFGSRAHDFWQALPRGAAIVSCLVAFLGSSHDSVSSPATDQMNS